MGKPFYLLSEASSIILGFFSMGFPLKKDYDFESFNILLFHNKTLQNLFI
jgi:hypothetical protein